MYKICIYTGAFLFKQKQKGGERRYFVLCVQSVRGGSQSTGGLLQAEDRIPGVKSGPWGTWGYWNAAHFP